MARATITSKGQVTIPKDVRTKLHLKTGDQVEFSVESRTRALLVPVNLDVRELRGVVKSSHARPATVEEMSLGVLDEAARHHERTRH